MIGAQLFGLRDAYARNPAAVLKSLADMGYEAVEPMAAVGKGLHTNPAAWTSLTMQARCDEAKALGLSVPSIHMDTGVFGRSSGKIINTIREVKEKTDISIFVFSGMFSTEKKAGIWGKLLRKVSEAVKDAGCTVLYHNHDMEFNLVNGRRLLDVFFEEAGPGVGLQLDIGWAGMAWDEIEAAKRYADRIVEIHCKDFFDGRGRYSVFKMPRKNFAPVGGGIIKMADVLKMADSFPRFNGVVIVDQDASAGDLTDDLRVGLSNLRGIAYE